MKLLEKKFDIDGHKEFYLSTVVFQYTTAEPEKKKLQAIQDAAVQAVQELSLIHIYGVTQKSRACGENPQVSALFVMDLSAGQHHDARRSK